MLSWFRRKKKAAPPSKVVSPPLVRCPYCGAPFVGEQPALYGTLKVGCSCGCRYTAVVTLSEVKITSSTKGNQL